MWTIKGESGEIKLWLLAYWWQALILVILYGFLYLIYKEILKDRLFEPAAIFYVVEGSLEFNQRQFKQGQVLVFYQNEQLKLGRDSIFAANGDVYLEQSSNTRKITPGEVFDFAGVSLQLMRWNNARQFFNQYRVGTEGQ